jgi:glycolate oxidase FAD binding subunit
MSRHVVAEFADVAREIVGPDHLRSGASAAPYRLGRHTPAWVVAPGDALAVGRVLAAAAAARLGVVPWGAGTHQSLGREPGRYDVALELTRLTRIVAHEPADMTVTAEAGIRLAELQRHLAAAGQFLPLDPPGADAATLGGILASNLSGPLRCRYGNARDLLLGLSVAGPDGRVTVSGSRVVKNATAYDLPKLHLGGLGTLGVIVEATLRVYPMQTAEGGWWIEVGDFAGAQALANRLLASPLTPTRVEILDAGAAARLRVGDSSGLLVSIAGVAESVAEQGRRLAALAAEQNGRVAALPDGPSLWARLRDLPGGDGHGDTPASRARFRGGVRSADCGRAMQAVSGVCEAVAATASHGILRGQFRPEGAETLMQTVREAREALERLGGYLVLLGTPAELRGLDPWGAPPDGLALMRELRRRTDPQDTLNPGRYLAGI